MTVHPLSCLACESQSIRNAPFGYSYKGAWLQAYECRACGVIFLHPQPPPEQISAMYSIEYFKSDFRCGHEGDAFNESTLEKLGADPILRTIAEYQPTGRLLEIGCASGVFLNAARAIGYEVSGVELSGEAASFARTRFGLNVIQGDLFEARIPSRSADIIFMGDVLEHLPNPADQISEINRILVPNGLLVILCPSQTNTIFSRLGFAAFRVLGRNTTVNMPPYHLFEYRPESVRKLLDRGGFSVVRLDSDLIPPGQIALRGSFLQNLGKRILQYPNKLLTSFTGRWGDRMTIYARKHG